MHFLSADLEAYAEQNSEKEPSLLAALARETHLKVLQPRMLSGHLQGRFLSLLSKLICPKYIVEIGTFTGYATLCLAEGLSQEGFIHTIEVNEELEEIQNKYFEQSSYRSQIIQHFAPALSVIPTLPDGIDLVFIDADKKNYPNYTQVLITYNQQLANDSRLETILLPIRDGLSIARVR